MQGRESGISRTETPDRSGSGMIEHPPRPRPARTRGLVRTYHQPVAVGLVLLVLLVLWNLQERGRARELGLREINQAAHQISDTLEASLQALVRRGVLDEDGVRVLLENVAASTEVTFVTLRIPGQTVIGTGDPPEGFEMEESHHHNFLAGQFVHVAVVRLQDSPLPYRHRYPDYDEDGDGDDATLLDLGDRPQLLGLGLVTDAYETHVGEAVARLNVLLVVGALCIVGLVFAWTVSIRNRELRTGLAEARLRAEHLDELELTARGLAHETRNPLGLVRGLAQRIHGDGEVPDAARDAAASIMEQADRAEAGLGDFLAYARPRPPRPRPVATGKLSRRICSLLEPDFEAAGVTLSCEGPEPGILADPDQLEQILVNLLLNSLQASPAGTAVTIRTAIVNGRGLLAVRDQGEGVDPALRDDIFKPYVTGRSDGHGLGLAIVRRIAEDHGWTVELRSPLSIDRGGGTEVILGGMELTGTGGESETTT